MTTKSEEQVFLQYARAGAKLQLQHILQTFPGLLSEVQRDRKIAQAAHARAVKQSRRQTGSHG